MQKNLFMLFFIFLRILSFANNGIANPDTVQPLRTLALQKGISANTKIIIVVNGIISAAGSIKEMGTDIDNMLSEGKAQNLIVLTSKEAEARYGEKGKNGAIEFTYININTVDTNTTNNRADSTFDKLEIEAKFPEGDIKWRNYLERNVNGMTGAENYAPPGMYTVIVQFVIDKEGNISDTKALTNYGFGMEEEAIRVISKSPKWEPAYQNKRTVKAYRKQPITFQVVYDFQLSKYSLVSGKENFLRVKARSLSDYNIDVSLSEGSITALKDGFYVAKVDNPGRVVLTVWDIRKNQKKEIGKVSLEVK